MEISSFSRMRSYRKDGYTSALLKLVLPCAKEAEEAFDVFYTDLAECYALVAEKLSDEAQSGRAPVVISVDFQLLTQTPDDSIGESVIAIKRIHRIRRGDKHTDGAFVDYFDEKRKIFVK